MIVMMLNLKCDFCTESYCDEFKNHAEARRIMKKHGWVLIKSSNGIKYDRCPDCEAVNKKAWKTMKREKKK